MSLGLFSLNGSFNTLASLFNDGTFEDTFRLLTVEFLKKYQEILVSFNLKGHPAPAKCRSIKYVRY